MKTKLTILILCSFVLSFAVCPHAWSQGTAMTYQGRLTDGGGNANGLYDFTFQLFDAANGGASQSGVWATNAVTLADGLFTVTLDFGAAPFSAGAARWLEITVRTNGAGAYGTIVPRQQVTATPYAIVAGVVTGPVSSTSLTGNYSNAVSFANGANSFSGSFSGNGAGITNLNPALLSSLPSSNCWNLNGNANPGQVSGGSGERDFLGTTDDRVLTFKVRGDQALALVPTPTNATHDRIVNVVGGSGANLVFGGVYGGTIAGGGARVYEGVGSPPNFVAADFGTVSGGVGNRSFGLNATVAGGAQNLAGSGNATVGGGQANTANGRSATVGGGEGNTASTNLATVSGGFFNQASGQNGTVAGGADNLASGGNATVSGGSFNHANGFFATIGGGFANQVDGNYGTVPGGENNLASGQDSFAAGQEALALHDGTFVWADSKNAYFASTSSNQFLIRASGGMGINTTTPVAELHVRGQMVIQGSALVPASTSSSNLLNLMVGGGSAPAATNGSLNGISFYESAGAAAMSLGYDGSGGASANALRIYKGDGSPLFTFEASGQLGVGTSTPQQSLHVIGNILASGTITGSSDRNVKEHFATVDPRAVLQKVAALPISEWNYKTDDRSLRHIGPMAQDFYSAFAVGMDDKHISMVDADGVALAAIQGLNQKLEGRTQKLEMENAELRRELAEIKNLLRSFKR